MGSRSDIGSDTDINIEKSRSHSKAMSSNLLLLLTAFIWGMAFVAQSVGMDYVGPFTFTAVRNLVAPAVLLPFIIITGRRNRRLEAVARGTETLPTLKESFQAHGGRKLILSGIITGTVLAFASSVQQIGIAYTTVGKAGFITAMYILIVPILGLFIGRRVPAKIWGCVAISIVGLYLLCMKDSLSFNFADTMLLLCALGFSVQILAIDYFTQMVDGVRMAELQFLVCGLICSVISLVFEHPQMSDILAAWKPILYAGALSSAVGYTLQIVAQKNTDPVIASLIMSLESAFSLIAGWIVLRQQLSARELFGCALMFIAIMISQMPSLKRISR